MTTPAPLFAHIALMGPYTDPKVADTMQSLTNYLHTQQRQVWVELDNAIPFTAPVQRAPATEFTRHCALIVAIGGDGTMLHTARLAAGTSIPIMGINRGRLGFLADFNPDTLNTRMAEVLQGQFASGQRALLAVCLRNAAGTEQHSLAMNDVVVQKWETGRMLDCETWINGKYVNTHVGDGVIVATATGSTAYALSCGGPIIHPDLETMVIAPICPHTLSDRPVVIPATSQIEIRRIQTPTTKAQVSCDGVLLGDLDAADRLLVKCATQRVNLIHPVDYDYYRILRSKLHWGRRGSTPRRQHENP